MIYDSGGYGLEADSSSYFITFTGNWVFWTHMGYDRYPGTCTGKTFCSMAIEIGSESGYHVVADNIFAGIWDKEGNNPVRVPAAKSGEWPN